MNIVYFKGGLGNQMFQYALYKALKHNGKAKVLGNLLYYEKYPEDRRFFLKSVFQNIKIDEDIQNIFEIKQKKYLESSKYSWIRKYNYKKMCFCQYFFEKRDGEFDSSVFQLRDASIEGYWQTEKYFVDIRKLLLNDFKFTIKDEKLIEIIEKINKKNTVSVHVRRGDYLNYPERYGDVCTMEYYKRAIGEIEKKVDFPLYVFLSDDIEWVQKMFPKMDALYIRAEIFTSYNDWYDMFIMSKCKHNIIANSSFSWWGAWLNQNNEKLVIAPKKWLNGCNMPDICPESWVRV